MLSVSGAFHYVKPPSPPVTPATGRGGADASSSQSEVRTPLRDPVRFTMQSARDCAGLGDWAFGKAQCALHCVLGEVDGVAASAGSVRHLSAQIVTHTLCW